MGRKIHIHIRGYGVVAVKRPKKLTKDAVNDLVAQTSAAVMSLVDPEPQIWHPVLGYTKEDNDA